MFFHDPLGGGVIMAKAIDPETNPKRYCAIPECGKPLAAYNKGDTCFHHPVQMESDSPVLDVPVIPPYARILLITVCEFFKISLEVLLGFDRNRELILARQIAMYLLSCDGKFEKKEIAWIFNRPTGRVNYPLIRVQYLIQTEPLVAEQIRQIRAVAAKI